MDPRFTGMKYKYYQDVDLIDRLFSMSHRADRAVTFLVGSPISLPDYVGGRGVPGVPGMIELIQSEFHGSEAEAELNKLLQAADANRYQTAFEFLHGRRGQDIANRIVRSAVWQALDDHNWPSHLPETSPEHASAEICEKLERSVDAWVLPGAVDHLGKLIVEYPTVFGGAILTTNFDPLIEISLSKHGGRFYRTVLHDDGKLGQTVADGTHIVHLHGYWHGFDTLHTPQQLVQQRPHLRRFLENIVEASTLVIIGYSGWDDVITRTLMGLLSDSTSNPEIMWAFHECEIARIETHQQALLHLLEPGVGRGRVSLYRGIDCRSVLAQLCHRLLPDHPTPSPVRPEPPNVAINQDRNTLASPLQKAETAYAREHHESPDSDRPLIVTPWVGRHQELAILHSLSSVTPVAFITGLGGQGKSALAGRFLQERAINKGADLDFWDWRDCKEESDRLSTQILRLVERLGDSGTNPSEIEVTDLRAVIAVLFRVLRNRPALIVFDNVDQYIDLETLRPVKGLEVFISEAQARTHQGLFLFTCRPDVLLDESRALKIPLSGLTQAETTALIKARGVETTDHDLARELHQTTNGHPLWVTLVAMQAVRHRKGLRGALESITHGGAELPDTLRSIWRSLNDQQRTVLRTMAELDRPESVNHLLDLIPGINANRVNRALRALRSFHMIETRERIGGDPLLGLHPIVRESIRNKFPKANRDQYAGNIVAYLGRKIGQFKHLLPQDPSFDILDNWIRKAEFDITFERFEEATATIAEISDALVNRGYSEELIRLTLRLLSEVDWAEACSSYKDFDTIFQSCLGKMIEVGHGSVGGLLGRYEAAIPGKSSQYILLCDLRCYAEWFVGRFDSAIRWGEEGERLTKLTEVDTRFSTRHHLALSMRDAGRISAAIESFLEGETLDVVVRRRELIQGKTAPFYGNIGRCLFLSGRLDEALPCYVKSSQILEESRTHGNRGNKGYVRHWIGELLAMQGEYGTAAASYQAAMHMWGKSAPPRAEQVRKRLEELVIEHPRLAAVLHNSDEEGEAMFQRWLGRQ